LAWNEFLHLKSETRKLKSETQKLKTETRKLETETQKLTLSQREFDTATLNPLTVAPDAPSIRHSTLLLAIQLSPALFLVLLGWGFDDLHSFSLNPARSGLAALTLASAAIAILLRLDFYPLRKGRAPHKTETIQLIVLLLLSLLFLWFLPFADRREILSLTHRSPRTAMPIISGAIWACFSAASEP
jgi:hypothetical protein